MAKQNSQKKKARKLRDKILNGRMISIDPASGGSSMPGMAVWSGGELEWNGTIEIDSRLPVHHRLASLREALVEEYCDVLVMERIRGSRAHASLQWSCGVIAGSIECEDLLELSTGLWKAYADSDYEKDDAADALYIGKAALEIANEEGG